MTGTMPGHDLSAEPFDHALVALGVKFIETPAPELHERIQQTLAWLGELYGADRVSLFVVDEGARLSRSAQYWVAPGAPDRPVDVSKTDLTRYPMIRDTLRENRILALTKLADIAEHVNEHALLDSLGTKSLLMIPIQVADQTRAILVMTSVRNERRWEEVDLERMTAVGKMIGGAQQRVESMTAAARWSAAFDSASWAVAFLDEATGQLQGGNRAFSEMHGVPVGDIIGQSMSSFVVGGCRWLSTEGVCTHGPCQVTHLRADGSRFPAVCSSSPIQDPVGGQTRVVHLLDDTERAQLEQEVRESRERFRALVEASYEGVVITVGGVVVDTNEAFGAMFGYTTEEVLGMTPFAVTTPEGGAECLRNIQEGRTEPYVVTGVCKDGRQFPLQIQGRECTYRGQRARVTGFRDLSEEYRAREESEMLHAQLRQSQKLESLGVLAGGIAHDFNNLLAAMLGYAELGLDALPPSDPAHLFMDRIRVAAERAASLTDQMLAYAGRGPFTPESQDLNRLVEEMADLLQVSVSKKAELRRLLEPGLPTVLADASQLRQVVMNLITNASDALGDDPGTVTLRTQIASVSRKDFVGTPFEHTVRPGTYVVLEVSDTGLGMSPATLERIFDPFFTTKFTGRGLGLAAVLGIVRAHDGAVRVRSNLGSGSTFEVFLPADNGHVVDEAAGRRPFGLERLDARVLVVDDEAIVRTMARDLLVFMGADVSTASDGSEAVELVRESGGFDVVLLDLTMPLMGGIEALGLIRELRPDLPVILVSGFSEVDLAREVAGQGATDFLKKPYGVRALRSALQRVLPGA